LNLWWYCPKCGEKVDFQKQFEECFENDGEASFIVDEKNDLSLFHTISCNKCNVNWKIFISGMEEIVPNRENPNMIIKFIGNEIKDYIGGYKPVLTKDKKYPALGLVTVENKCYYLLESDDNGALQPPVPCYESMFKVVFYSNETIMVCPECGDENCYTSLEYEKCEECGYFKQHESFDCPCCGNKISCYDVCPICYWEKRA